MNETLAKIGGVFIDGCAVVLFCVTAIIMVFGLVFLRTTEPKRRKKQ